MKHILLLIFVFFAMVLSAQNVLLVKKTGSVKRYIFKPGNYISLRTVEGQKVEGPINAIRSDHMIVDFTNKILIADIQTVYSSRRLLKSISAYMMAMSAVYTGLDLINNRFNIENSGLWTASGVFGAGLLGSLLSKKRMSNKRHKWHFEILTDF